MVRVFQSDHEVAPLTDHRDANHRLDRAVRFACTLHLEMRLRRSAREVKRRTLSEYIRQVLERHEDSKDALARVP